GGPSGRVHDVGVVVPVVEVELAVRRHGGVDPGQEPRRRIAPELPVHAEVGAARRPARERVVVRQSIGVRAPRLVGGRQRRGEDERGGGGPAGKGAGGRRGRPGPPRAPAPASSPASASSRRRSASSRRRTAPWGRSRTETAAARSTDPRRWGGRGARRGP